MNKLPRFAFGGPFRALKHRNLRLFSIGHVLSQVGTRFHEVGAGWLMWQLTGSAAWLGALALAEIVPRLLLWPVTGLLADRMDRRRVATIFQTLSAIEAGVLAILTAADLMNPWLLLAGNALLGLNNAFWAPVRMSLIPRLVPMAEIATAVALMSLISNVARVAGPILAGPAIIWGGVETAFAVNAISFFAVVIALQMMHLTSQDTMPGGSAKASRGIWHGLAVVAAHPGMRPLFLLIGAFALTIRAVTELLPAFAETVFQRGPGGYAVMISVIGVGALLAGVILSWRSSLTGLTTVMATFGIVGALATTLLAMTSSFELGLLCIGFIGLGVTGKNIAAQTLVQTGLEDSVRGRVLSLYIVIFTSAPAAGALAMGYVADRVGIAAPVMIASFIGLAASLAVFARRRYLAKHLEVSSVE